jgi:Sulfotransferase family
MSHREGRSSLLPDFLIAGVPKAGTTALYAALLRHPGLFLPETKEPKFFLSDGPPPARGGPGDVQTYQEHVWRRSDYETLFAPAPPGTLRGEATPFYLYDRQAHRRIHELIPEAKLILVLRDPVDRAHSNWTHLWTAGLEPSADFLEACALEPTRRAAGWAYFWHYLGLGEYGSQVRDLFELFHREQVLIIRYRDLRDTPAATLDRVCAFLGVATGVIDRVPAENVSWHVADTRFNAMIRFLLRSGGRFGHRFPVPVRQALSRPLLSVLHRRDQGRRPQLTRDQRAALIPHFTADIRLLEELTGDSYADWLTVSHLARVES